MRWLARMAIVLLLVWFGWLCVALAVDTDAKTPKTYWRVTLNGRYLNGDSADVLVAYPADEDTAGNRISCTWIGGTYNVWQFAPDSTDVYDFYGRASTGADTLIAYMTDRWVQGATASEGFISSSRAFGSAVVPSSALSSGAALANLLSGTTATITSSGASGGLEVETNLTVGDSATIGGVITANGDYIYLGNTNSDQVIIAGDLTVQDDMVFGATDIDEAEFKGPIILTDSITDTLSNGVQQDTVLVPGVSTIKGKGGAYRVRCAVYPAFNFYQLLNDVDGAGYQRSWYAAPFSQAAATGDSVLVRVNSTLTDDAPYTCVCWGEN